MDLRQCFDQYDSGNDGYITFKEFQDALKESNYAEADIEKIFKSIVSLPLTEAGNNKTGRSCPRCCLWWLRL